MKKFIILMFVFFVSTFALAEQIPNQLGLDWRTDKPTGKNWVKISDMHYLDKSSLKNIKATIYQARLCNELKLPNGGIVWNYFNVKVECKGRKAYSQSNGEWIGPMPPTGYEIEVLDHACK
jgi:hypothetical protein